MLNLIIAILISLGYLNSPEDWNNLTPEQQQQHQTEMMVLMGTNTQ